MSGLPGFDSREPDFAAGTVTGARWWNLVLPGDYGGYPDPVLSGVRGAWEPGVNTARCGHLIPGGHEVPREECGCGFWAYWEVQQHPNPHGFGIPVLGVIEGWGRTLIGDRGFRCASARITALHLADGVLGSAVIRMSADTRLGHVDFRTEAAAETWHALCGRGKRERLSLDEAAARLAETEFLLGDRYSVPVYATRDLMLIRHPLTADYLPSGKRRARPPGRRLTAMEALERVMLTGPDAAMLKAQHAARGLKEPGSR